MDFLTPEISLTIKNAVFAILTGFAIALLDVIRKYFIIWGNKLQAEIETIKNETIRDAIFDAVNAVEQIAEKAAEQLTSEDKYEMAVAFLADKGITNVSVADIEAVVKQLKDEWNKPLAVE